MPFTFGEEQEIQKLVVETCPSIFFTYPANFPLMTYWGMTALTTGKRRTMGVSLPIELEPKSPV
jgi:hypothetical protein